MRTVGNSSFDKSHLAERNRGVVANDPKLTIRVEVHVTTVLLDLLDRRFGSLENRLRIIGFAWDIAENPVALREEGFVADHTHIIGGSEALRDKLRNAVRKMWPEINSNKDSVGRRPGNVDVRAAGRCTRYGSELGDVSVGS